MLCESVDLMGLGTHAPMVRGSKGPILLDPSEKKIGLLDLGTAVSEGMCSSLPGRL